jgi:hypothetical protein
LILVNHQHQDKRVLKEQKNDNSLLASLDVAKISDRNASLIVIPTISNLGHNPEKFNVSYSSIRRARQNFRKKVAENLKTDFKSDVPLTIHWDGKLLEDITGDKVVDRLPILISGLGVDQLLGVPKLTSGTGENTATAVYEKILEWNVYDKVKCMCFDTTASNTGRRIGACVLIEQKMDNDMLWFACRHHILDIMLEAVVSLSLSVSSGPDIQIFKRFKANWLKLDKQTYQTAADCPVTVLITDNIKEDIIRFAMKQLDECQPRDDYKELLELSIIFLGGTPKSGVNFKKPGAHHRARWMAKVIYSMKIWMFKSQFKLTKSEEKGLRDISCFAVEVYLKSWFTAPAATSAPRMDLQLLKSLQLYKEKDQRIATAALKKMLNHLWYISEELVALAFFDEDVTLETKNKMRDALQNPSEPNHAKRTTIDTEVIEIRQLEDFVTTHTRRFFDILGLPCTFLEKSPKNWSQD